MSSRLIGALFLAGFLTYGMRFALVSSVMSAPDFLSTTTANQTPLVIGSFLTIGVLSLLLLAPIVHHGAIAGQSGWANGLGSLVVQSNSTAYQIAEVTLALGCIFLFLLLFRSRLVPRFLSVWGLAGNALHMVGRIVEVSGLHIGLAFSIPGGLLEVTLGPWLIINGFAPAAYGRIP